MISIQTQLCQFSERTEIVQILIIPSYRGSHTAIYPGSLEGQKKFSHSGSDSPVETVEEATQILVSHPDGIPSGPTGGEDEAGEVGASQPDGNTIQGPTPSDRERSALITARAVKLSKVYNAFKAENSNRYIYHTRPPTRIELRDSMKTLNIPSKLYQAPHYSRDEDIPELPKEFAGLSFHLKGGQGIAHLEDWDTDDVNTTDEEFLSDVGTACELNPVGVGGWEYAHHPPSTRELRRTMFLIKEGLDIKAKLRSQVRNLFIILLSTHKASRFPQIEGPTQANIYGFKTSPARPIKHEFREAPAMSILSVEIFGR